MVKDAAKYLPVPCWLKVENYTKHSALFYSPVDNDDDDETRVTRRRRCRRSSCWICLFGTQIEPRSEIYTLYVSFLWIHVNKPN